MQEIPAFFVFFNCLIATHDYVYLCMIDFCFMSFIAALCMVKYFCRSAFWILFRCIDDNCVYILIGIFSWYNSFSAYGVGVLEIVVLVLLQAVNGMHHKKINVLPVSSS